jgi:hypothetical protein
MALRLFFVFLADRPVQHFAVPLSAAIIGCT